MTTEKTEELSIRFNYHAPHGDQPMRYQKIRAHALSFALAVDELCPESREASIALTHIEEAMFYANAAIARRMPKDQPPIDNNFVAPGCEKFSSCPPADPVIP